MLPLAVQPVRRAPLGILAGGVGPGKRLTRNAIWTWLNDGYVDRDTDGDCAATTSSAVSTSTSTSTSSAPSTTPSSWQCQSGPSSGADDDGPFGSYIMGASWCSSTSSRETSLENAMLYGGYFKRDAICVPEVLGGRVNPNKISTPIIW